MASRPYEMQIAPGGTAPLPLAQGGFGEGAAAGLQQIVKAGEAIADKVRDMHNDQEWSDYNQKMAQTRLDLDRQRDQARMNAGPGAVGYADSQAKAFDDATRPLLDGLSSSHLRARAAASLAETRTNWLDGEYQYELTAGAAKTVTDTGTAIDAASARVRTSGDATAYASEARSTDDMINGLTGIDAAERDKLRTYAHKSLAKSKINNLIDSNPSVAVAAIDAGGFNDILSGEELDPLRAQADVAVRRIASEKEHQANLVKAQIRESVQTINAQLEQGIVVPDDQLAAAATAAGGVGDTSTAFNLQSARVRAGVNAQTKGWTPQQYDARMNALRAKGDKATPQEQIELDQLGKIAPQRIGDFNKDPGAWAATNGVPPPALDWNNPGTLAARRQWQSTEAKASGRPTPFLSPNEVADLKAEAENSPAGEVDVINRVALIDGNGDLTGGQLAQKEMLRILPNDPKAARLVLLNPSVRAQALAGIKLLDQRHDLLTDKVARPSFDSRLGAAGALMDGNQLEGAYAVAKGIYVDSQRKAGKLGGELDQGAWNMAIHRALGGRFDGEHWFGGVWSWGKAPVIIPNTVTGKQFEGAMTWMRSSKWSDRDTTVPVYSDGKTVIPQSKIPDFTPVMRPDGKYEFHGPGGTIVHSRNGGIFLMDVANLARRFPQ
jgi:hypothetical protein